MALSSSLLTVACTQTEDADCYCSLLSFPLSELQSRKHETQPWWSLQRWVTLLQATLKCQFIVKRSQPCVVFTLWVKDANIILHTLRIIFHVAAGEELTLPLTRDPCWRLIFTHIWSFSIPGVTQTCSHSPWHLEPTAGAERIIKMFSSNVHKLWFYRSWDREKRCSLFVNVPNTKVHQEQMVVTTELQPCLFSSAQNVMPTYVWEKAGRIMTET